MGSMMALYDNLADGGILTGPASLMPLSNMQSEFLERVWRSTSADAADTTFDISLPEVVTLRAIVLARTNATTANRTRFRAFQDAEHTIEIYDSGWQQNIVRALWGSEQWGSRYWFTGFRPHDDPDRPPDLVHILPGNGITVKYWTVEIDDPENGDGYFQISRLMMAKAFIPSLNYSFGGNGLGFEDNSPRQRTLNGGELVRRRVNPRIMQFAIDYLPEDEAFTDFYDFVRRSGFDREVYFIPDTELTGVQLQRRSFLGTITQPDPIRQNAFQRASVGCTIKERI